MRNSSESPNYTKVREREMGRTVTDVSAILVLKMTFLVPGGGLLKASSCCREGRVA